MSVFLAEASRGTRQRVVSPRAAGRGGAFSPPACPANENALAPGGDERAGSTEVLPVVRQTAFRRGVRVLAGAAEEAASRSASFLSVRSQVNSLSERPK